MLLQRAVVEGFGGHTGFGGSLFAGGLARQAFGAIVLDEGDSRAAV